MNDREALAAQCLKAMSKVKSQQAVVARLDGAAPRHTEEAYLLREMRQNLVMIDINRALLEFGQGDTSDGSPR